MLDEHQVRYVLIGGFAATLHGSPIATGDADICPARDRRNLERLAAALTDLDARIRTEDVPQGLPFSRSAEFLERTEILNLATRSGDLDVAFRPSGTAGYDGLLTGVVTYDRGAVQVPVAPLRDAVRS